MKKNLTLIGSCLLALYLCLPSAICQDRPHFGRLEVQKTPFQDVRPARYPKNGSRFSALLQSRTEENNDIQPVQQQSNILSIQMEVNRYTPDANWKELGPMTTIEKMDNSDFRNYEIDRNGIINFQIAPYDPNVMWMSTFSSGIWKTWNAGRTWIPISRHTLKGSYISAFAVDPFNPNTIYAASNFTGGEPTGLHKTIDGGGTWQLLRTVNFDYITNIIIHPQQNNKILTTDNVEIQYSENAGATWTKVYDTDYDYNVMKLAQSPNNPDIVYARAVDANGMKVIKSINFGKTWSETGLNRLPANIVLMDIAVAPTDANTIYAMYAVSTATGGTEATIKRSTDGGTTWTTQSSGYQNLLGYYELKITVDSDNKDKLYFATPKIVDNTPDGIYVSQDGGRTIGLIGTPIKTLGISPVGLYMSDLKHHPISKELICTFYEGGAYKLKTDALDVLDIRTLNCTLSASRLYNVPLWPDNCATLRNNWVRISDGISTAYALDIVKKDNVVLASCGNVLLKWDGAKWVQLTSLGGVSNAAFLGNTNSFLIEEHSGLSKTTDGGKTFRNLLPQEAQLEPVYYRAPIHVSAQNINVAYSLRTNLWKTTNGGDTWTKMTIPPDTLNRAKAGSFMAVAPSNDNIVYVASRNFNTSAAYIHKTTDGGLTFTDIKRNLPNLYLDRIMVHPTNPNRVWVLFQRTQLYESNDGGNTWTNISAGLLPFPITRSRAMGYDAQRNTLYIGTDFGVFVKSANDNQFRPYQVGMPYIPIYDLEIDAANNKIYAGTGSGVWVGDLYDNSPNTNAAMRQENRVQLSPIVALYPNPVANFLTVGINAPLKSEWQVRLLNNLGQAAYVYTGRETQRFDINVKSFNSGLYFLEYTEGGNKKVEKVMIQH